MGLATGKVWETRFRQASRLRWRACHVEGPGSVNRLVRAWQRRVAHVSGAVKLDARTLLAKLFAMFHWVPYGPQALLLRFADGIGDDAFRRSRAILAELERHPPVGLVECVPGFTTMLLRFEPGQRGNLPWLGRFLAGQLSALAPADLAEAPVKEIPVTYDGEDLESLAEAKEMSPSEVVELHSEPVYKVYLLGFSPGFPYLGELPGRLHTPRRATPRPRVRAGSVAIGGEHTGIYSVESPGGWQIIGHTNVTLFAVDRLEEAAPVASLFHLQPGDRVRFVPLKP